MLIGAHVSTGGGLTRAVERGQDLECDAIQIFNQSPRMWRPTRYSEDDFAEFREAFADSRLQSVVIHMIYLINPAGADKEMRAKSLQSLKHAMWVGEGIGADGVIVHPGALKGDVRGKAKRRSVSLLKQALADTERCPLLLENNAGSQALLGLGFDELGDMIEKIDAGDRVGLCIDSCHLHAYGYDVRTPEGVAGLVDDLERDVGLERLRCIHLNDSKDKRGSYRDRHENIGTGEIGRKAFEAFLSEPRFQRLPALLETPGPDGHGPDRKQVRLTKRLHAAGLEKR